MLWEDKVWDFFFIFYKIIFDYFINLFFFVKLYVFNFGEIDFNDI